MSLAKSALPPHLDALAALSWLERAQPKPAWLSEEVARRMQQRLDWIRTAPTSWADWHPGNGGWQGHALLRQRHPRAGCWVVEPTVSRMNWARQHLAEPWWQSWHRGKRQVGLAPTQAVDMVWANMLLHQSEQPLALLKSWHQSLNVDGFVMFSALGPDSLRELHALHERMQWGSPGLGMTVLCSVMDAGSCPKGVMEQLSGSAPMNVLCDRYHGNTTELFADEALRCDCTPC